MNHAALAQALLEAVRSQQFERTADAMRGGGPVEQHPSIDLAVAAFPPDAPPVFANVLFSREYPQGLVAGIAPDAGAVRQIAFLADQRDAQGNSIAWWPDSDWSRLSWQPLTGEGPQRFVAPYPASLLKLMVLVAVARLVDQGRSDWQQGLVYQGRERPVGNWAFDMTAISCNTSTSALVAHLHACGMLAPESGTMRHELHRLFESLGLRGLRLANTQPDGGWGNGAGSGVGQIQMMAWDTLRLLWLIDPAAPPAPWLPAGLTPLLRGSRAHVLHCLREQGLHHILSSSVLAGLPGWVPGLPAKLPQRWLRPDGSAWLGEDLRFPGDLRWQREHDMLEFAHKTGNTENYSANAGIVRGVGTARRHYLIALTSNLGSRYAAGPGCATTWRLPALGAVIDARLHAWLGD